MYRLDLRPPGAETPRAGDPTRAGGRAGAGGRKQKRDRSRPQTLRRLPAGPPVPLFSDGRYPRHGRLVRRLVSGLGLISSSESETAFLPAQVSSGPELEVCKQTSSV